MRMTTKSLRYGLLASVALSSGSPLLAQTTATTPEVGSANASSTSQPASSSPRPATQDASIPQPTDPASTAPTGQAATEPAPGGIGDIVVTAQRRSERLQSIPASITAVSAGQIAAANITSTRDLQRIAPTLNFTQSGPVPGPAIRGIGARGSTPGDEQEVPLYIDGIYQPFLLGGVQELNNIERVEVLNGPQGVLLGRNAIGGAINIVTSKPTVEPEARFMVGIGNFGRKEAQGYISGGRGNIAASIAGAFYDDDGYVFNRTLNRHVASVNSQQVRGKVYWQPDPDTEVTATATYQYRSDSTGSATVALNGNSAAAPLVPGGLPKLPRYVVVNSPQYNPNTVIKQFTAALTLVHHFDGFDLTSSTGYNDSQAAIQTDSDGALPFVRYLRYLQKDNGLVQETYLTSTGLDRLKLIGGVFLFHDIAAFDPINSAGTILYTKTTTNSYALYGQAAYDISDKLTATVGGRYSKDRKRGQARNLANTRILDSTATFSHFDPSATLEYKFSKNLLVYGKYSTAFKSGLFNNTNFQVAPVNEESVRSFEVGFKSDPASWLRLNAAAYYTTYDNIQVASRDPITQIAVLQNAASAKIYGGEVNFEARPVRALNLRGAVTLLHSAYGSFPFAAVQAQRPPAGTVGSIAPCPANAFPCGNATISIDAEGNRLTRVPDVAGSLGADYTLDTSAGAFTLSGTASYTSRLYWQPDRRISNPPRADVNMQLSWTSPDSALRIAAYVENLTNNFYYLSRVTTSAADIGYYGRPRSFGVRLSSKM